MSCTADMCTELLSLPQVEALQELSEQSELAPHCHRHEHSKAAHASAEVRSRLHMLPLNCTADVCTAVTTIGRSTSSTVSARRIAQN